MTTRDLSSNQFARCRCILFSSLLLISDPTSCKCKWSASPPLKPLKSHLQKWVTKWTADRGESEGYYSPVLKSGRTNQSAVKLIDFLLLHLITIYPRVIMLIMAVSPCHYWRVSISQTDDSLKALRRQKKKKKWRSESEKCEFIFSQTPQRSLLCNEMGRWWGDVDDDGRERETRSPSFIWFASG